MDYSNHSVSALLRGPLISTSEGWVVLLSFLAYAALAVAYGVFGVNPPMGRSAGTAVTGCLIWPFIVFLFFVKNGLPSFKSSAWGTAFLVLCSAMPVIYTWWPL